MKNDNYSKIFPTNESKAEAFDKIAELYYDRNFGTVSKSDLDVLMFSIYIEQILKQSEVYMETYCDYELSKQLGITQSKIRNLKIKKELKYPYKNFDWKKSFARLSKTAYFENGKIHIHISDPNLFIELKHFVETQHGNVEITLNTSLFIVSIDVFIALILHIGDEDDKKLIFRNIRNTYRNEQINIENIEKTSIVKCLKENSEKVATKLVLQNIKHCAQGLKSPLNDIVTNIVDLISE